MPKSTSHAGRYQGCMPVTSKNIGKNHLDHWKAKTYSGPGSKEQARAAKRLAQMEKQTQSERR
jgi:hypothetical protein